MSTSQGRWINKGDTPIYESGLADLLQRNLSQNFRATTDLRQAVLDSNLTMIAVGTPFDGDDINLQFIRQAASQVGSALRDSRGLSRCGGKEHCGTGHDR